MNILASVVAVKPLRQRLIGEMEIRQFGPETQRNYIHDADNELWKWRRKLCGTNNQTGPLGGGRSQRACGMFDLDQPRD